MKKYIAPIVKMIKFTCMDVITSSGFHEDDPFEIEGLFIGNTDED